MKLKMALLFIFGSVAINSAFAEGQHLPPQTQKSFAKGASFDCKITVVNNAYYPVTVSGTYDDYSSMLPFEILPYGYDVPRYIPLVNTYYNICDAGMTLNIRTFAQCPYSDGCSIYKAYTAVGSVVYVNPSIAAKADSKAQVTVKRS